MTKIDQAIAYFQECSCKAEDMQSLRFNSLAIAALKKAQPIAVNHERFLWRYHHFCPICSEQIKIENLKYCEYCSQRLDWSQYNSGIKYLR